MDMERRTSDRLIAKVPTFAVVRPDFSIAGKIVNIHKGGFCFQYIVSGRNLVDAETVGIDLFLDNNKLYLHGISCKKIYDIDISRKSLSFNLECRRCGLQFQNLSQKNTDLLALYLKEFTSGSCGSIIKSSLRRYK
ncbi:MAG: hypothetical protein JRI86_02550 [Deltaproteobacteria bacterium]|nr:hypothetical protein [Deltaproteobacteria bacterium]